MGALLDLCCGKPRNTRIPRHPSDTETHTHTHAHIDALTDSQTDVDTLSTAHLKRERGGGAHIHVDTSSDAREGGGGSRKRADVRESAIRVSDVCHSEHLLMDQPDSLTLTRPWGDVDEGGQRGGGGWLAAFERSMTFTHMHTHTHLALEGHNSSSRVRDSVKADMAREHSEVPASALSKAWRDAGFGSRGEEGQTKEGGGVNMSRTGRYKTKNKKTLRLGKEESVRRAWCVGGDFKKRECILNFS